MGTALTPEHIAMLRALNVEIRLCLDGDLPGQKAMMEISKALARNGLTTRIVDNQGSSKDADEILNEDGPDALKNYLNNLIDRIDFVLNYYKRTNPLKTSEEKKKLVANFVPVLLGVKSQLELSSYIRKLAGITGFDVDSIEEVVNKARNAPKDKLNDVYYEFRPERKALRRLETAERELLYQMLKNPAAIAFYEENNMYFFDEVYRKIADYLIEYISTGESLDISNLIAYLEYNGVPNLDAIKTEISDITFEDTHSTECSPNLLNELKESIDDEKTKIFEKDSLQQLLNGKTPLEQARIYNDFVQRKKNRKK
jgi:DNA primase